MDIAGLQDLLSEFTYAQTSILEREGGFEYNPLFKRYRVAKLRSFSPETTTGSCSELVATAYWKIRSLWPDLHVLRAEGKDPEFFTAPGENHEFLLVSKTAHPLGSPYTEDISPLLPALEDQYLLVDPSFEKVAPFAESGYTIKRAIEQGFPVLHPQTPVFSEHYGFPIGMSSQQELVSLIFRPDATNRTAVSFIKGEECTLYDLQRKNLEQRLKNEDLLGQLTDTWKQEALSYNIFFRNETDYACVQ